MAHIKSLRAPEAFWRKIEPLVPARKRPRGWKYRRKPGAGRKPTPARQIFAAIVNAPRTGCQWKALPRECGSASAMHAHFQLWQREGFFLKIWKAGPAEYDQTKGIGWGWRGIDAAYVGFPAKATSRLNHFSKLQLSFEKTEAIHEGLLFLDRALIGWSQSMSIFG